MHKTIIIKEYAKGGIKSIKIDDWVTDEAELKKYLKKEHLVNRGTFIVAHVNGLFTYISTYLEGIGVGKEDSVIGLSTESMREICKIVGELDGGN